MEAVKVPAGQPTESEKQDAAPAALVKPAGHRRQSESSVEAVMLLKVPVGHCVEKEEPLVVKEPGGQQMADPGVLNWPEAQGKQDVWPVEEYWFAGHKVHEEEVLPPLEL